MASGLFTSYANILWGTGTRVDWDTDTIKAVLIDSADVTISRTTHDFYDDISAGAVGTPGTLDSVVISAGAVDAADEVFSTVSGDTAEQVVLYKDTGVAGTSSLLILFDAGGFTSGMPVTPNGGNITLSFNASGIATFV